MFDSARTRPLLLPSVARDRGTRIVSAASERPRIDVSGRIPAFELACRCVADNDNVPGTGAELRVMLGIVLVGPLMGCLGLAALLVGLSPS